MTEAEEPETPQASESDELTPEVLERVAGGEDDPPQGIYRHELSGHPYD